MILGFKDLKMQNQHGIPKTSTESQNSEFETLTEEVSDDVFSQKLKKDDVRKISECDSLWEQYKEFNYLNIGHVCLVTHL